MSETLVKMEEYNCKISFHHLCSIASDNESNSDISVMNDLENLENLSSISSCPESDSEEDEKFSIEKKRPRKSSFSESDDDSNDWQETDQIPNIEAFEGVSGVKILPSSPEKVSEVVNMFIGEDLFEMLCTESNLFYNQNKDKFKNHFKCSSFKTITVPEMKKFLALLLVMSQVKRTELKDYWTTNPIYEIPIFKKTMPRNRFLQIWRCWNFGDNSEANIFKVELVLKYFLEKFRNIYKPGQNICVNEGMIPWRGKLSFRTYNPKNIIKYGLLVRMVSESKSGYIVNFKIYCGQENNLNDDIYSLLEPCTGLWHHVYLDNYYTSVNTAEGLLKKKIRVCGTINACRGLPGGFKKRTEKLKHGESHHVRKGDILLQGWRDKRLVRIISTIHDSKITKLTDKNNYSKMKPKCVIDFNKYMNGVDRFDQSLSSCSLLRSSKKWSKKVVLYLINCALVNSFHVYKELNPGKKLNMKKYIEEVTKFWLYDTEEVTRTKPKPAKKLSVRTSSEMEKHFIEPIKTNGQQKYPTKACFVCTRNKKRKYTRYICSECKVPLHKEQCFQIYHSNGKN